MSSSNFPDRPSHLLQSIRLRLVRLLDAKSLKVGFVASVIGGFLIALVLHRPPTLCLVAFGAIAALGALLNLIDTLEAVRSNHYVVAIWCLIWTAILGWMTLIAVRTIVAMGF